MKKDWGLLFFSGGRLRRGRMNGDLSLVNCYFTESERVAKNDK